MTRINFEKASSFHTPEESPGFLLWRASIGWRRAIESILKPFQLTHPQFVILATVGWLTKEGEKASQADIGRQAGLDPNTTSQILRSLQAKHLIERSHSKDERSKYPSLTEAGSKLLASALPAVENADSHFFSNVDLQQESAITALKMLAGIETDLTLNRMPQIVPGDLYFHESYDAPLSRHIQKQYHKLMSQIAKIPTASRLNKKIEGPGGLISVADWIAYHIGWGKRVIAWYQAGLKGNHPQMPGEGFKTWDYIGLAKHFYQKYRYDGSKAQDLQFYKIVKELIKITETEHITERLDQTSVWPWCTLKSGKLWPLSKWIQVNTVSPYKKTAAIIGRYAKTFD